MSATGALQDEVQTITRRNWLSRYYMVTQFTRKCNYSYIYAHNRSTAFLVCESPDKETRKQKYHVHL